LEGHGRAGNMELTSKSIQEKESNLEFWNLKSINSNLAMVGRVGIRG
jgi:hypothetical protein